MNTNKKTRNMNHTNMKQGPNSQRNETISLVNLTSSLVAYESLNWKYTEKEFTTSKHQRKSTSNLLRKLCWYNMLIPTPLNMELAIAINSLHTNYEVKSKCVKKSLKDEGHFPWIIYIQYDQNSKRTNWMKFYIEKLIAIKAVVISLASVRIHPVHFHQSLNNCVVCQPLFSS